MKPNQDLCEEMAQIVDQSTLVNIIAALELMCYEKAAMVRQTWQDTTLASQWELCARALYRANVVVVKTNL